MLTQVHKEHEKVVAHDNHNMSKAEMKYCATRRELSSVVSLVKYYKHFLLGRPLPSAGITRRCNS